MARSLYIAYTQYHLMSMVCYRCAVERMEGECDLVIVDCFPRAAEYASALESTGLFRKVVCCDFNEFPRERFEHARRIADMLFRRGALGADFECDTGLSLAEGAYSRVVSGNVNKLTIEAALALGEGSEVVFVDEGTGSYSGEVGESLYFFDDILSAKRYQGFPARRAKFYCKRLLDRLTFGRLRLGVGDLFLFNPELVSESAYANVAIKPLPYSDGVSGPILSKVFKTERVQSLYSGKTFVLLGLPDDVEGDVLAVQDLVLSRMSDDVGGQMVFRPHPRYKLPTSADVECDESGSLWEMLCMQGAVRPDMVLVSFFSTAQVSPKWMFDVEPYQVFLFRLLPKGNQFRKVCEEMMGRLSVCYRDKAKIFAPESEEELRSVLEGLRAS